MSKSTRLCRGCMDDFYNGNNELGVKVCLYLKNARPVTRYAIGTWTLPATPGAFRAVKVYSCYRTESTSGISHYDKPPDCAVGVRR